MYGMGLIHKIEGPKKRCYLPNPSCTEILIKGTFFFFGGQLFHVVTEIWTSVSQLQIQFLFVLQALVNLSVIRNPYAGKMWYLSVHNSVFIKIAASF